MTLTKNFEVKDLGQLRKFLGMEAARTRREILVSQNKYALDLLKETNMLGYKPTQTLIKPNGKFRKDAKRSPINRGGYQRLVGRLIYLSHTRPDIASAISVGNQHMHLPHEKHLKVIHQIL